MSGFPPASASGQPAKPTAVNMSAFAAQAQLSGRPPTAVAPSAPHFQQPPHHQQPAQGSPVAVSCLPIDPLNVKHEPGLGGRAQSLPFGSRPATLAPSQPAASSLQVGRGKAFVHAGARALSACGMLWRALAGSWPMSQVHGPCACLIAGSPQAVSKSLPCIEHAGCAYSRASCALLLVAGS